MDLFWNVVVDVAHESFSKTSPQEHTKDEVGVESTAVLELALRQFGIRLNQLRLDEDRNG